MARQKKCPECPPEGAPAWMNTYGDMVTLLLTFFVLLISFSSVQEAKFKEAMKSLQGALGVLPASGAAIVNTGNGEFPNKATLQSLSDLQKAVNALNGMIEQMQMDSMIRVEQSRDRIHIRIANPVLFESGSANLRSDIAEVMSGIAEVLRQVPYEVRIEGHTDNMPIATAQYPSNWELSAARAASVVRDFVSEGIDPSRFLAVGFGEYRPIADNATELGRSMNRRVEIYISLKKTANDTIFEESTLKNTKRESEL